MCHTTESQRFERQVTWERIAKEFGLTKKEKGHLQDLYKASTYFGWSIEYSDVPVKKNKVRLLTNLEKKEVLKVFNSKVILNPSILIGRSGWSQFNLGVMVVQWMNERLIAPRRPAEWEYKSMKLGCEYAKEDQARTEIPFTNRGRVQGRI
jgi:hypothetical protein